MADREELHALVDSLPDGALQSAAKYLNALQTWPPKKPEYPPEVAQLAMLHQLIDTLPQPAWTRVQQILEFQQNAIDTHEDLTALQDKMQLHIHRHLRRSGGGVAGSGGGGSMFPDGSGHFSVEGCDDDGAHLTLTYRYFRGRRLELAERVVLSPENHSLVYRINITGPDGKESEHEVEFAIPESSS